MARFETTRWSLILATREQTPDASAALDALCEFDLLRRGQQ